MQEHGARGVVSPSILSVSFGRTPGQEALCHREAQKVRAILQGGFCHFFIMRERRLVELPRGTRASEYLPLTSLSVSQT